ncbi:hypothetical protein EVAR_24474_1 [Eumeta japonica]|uniref:Uncharacterized protein n=1 Tax=Eumeta variegata TaxID=151549 RepID=A0A4C1WV25_EUMVA|nr:hypothetical protein EVAR_24474_1 [Eumeta japonica]
MLRFPVVNSYAIRFRNFFPIVENPTYRNRRCIRLRFPHRRGAPLTAVLISNREARTSMPSRTFRCVKTSETGGLIRSPWHGANRLQFASSRRLVVRRGRI